MAEMAQVEESQLVEEGQLITSNDDWENLGGSATGTAAPISYGGTLWAFTRNTDQSVGYCNVGTKKWSSIGGQITGNPAVAQSPNASLAVAGLQQNGQIQINYINPFDNTGTGWGNFAGGAPSGIAWARTPAPVIAVNNNMRIEAFAIDTNGRMWHTYQTTVQPPIQWTNWSPLSNNNLFSTSAKNMVVFLSRSDGALRAVALGRDNNIYMAVQYAGGGYDGWSPFETVGMGGGVDTQFTAGVGANFSTSAQTNVFGAYNAAVGQNENPLVWCNPPGGGQSTWATLNTTEATFPIAGEIPSLVADNGGLIHMAWLSAGNVGQSYMISQSGSSWQQQPVLLGSQNGNFTGALSGLEASSALQFFQLAGSSLFHISINP